MRLNRAALAPKSRLEQMATRFTSKRGPCAAGGNQLPVVLDTTLKPLSPAPGRPLSLSRMRLQACSDSFSRSVPLHLQSGKGRACAQARQAVPGAETWPGKVTGESPIASLILEVAFAPSRSHSECRLSRAHGEVAAICPGKHNSGRRVRALRCTWVASGLPVPPCTTPCCP